jgi:hypothetical protein
VFDYKLISQPSNKYPGASTRLRQSQRTAIPGLNESLTPTRCQP